MTRHVAPAHLLPYERTKNTQAKSRVITECREAIKSNNIPSLFRIIKLGGVKGT